MYVIAGATTAAGRQLVPQLLQRGLAVRVLVRKDADAEHFAKLGADVARGDLRDVDALTRAVQGAHTVVSLIGRHFADTQKEFWQVEVQGVKNLVQSARAARAEHFVLLSALWADRDPGPLLFRAKRQAEDFLMQSGLRHTILRPSMFATGPAGSPASLVGGLAPMIERSGTALVPAPDSKPISALTLHDLADALLTAALSSGSESKIYELGGPEALTLGQAALRIAAVLGRRVRVVRVPRLLLTAGRVMSRLRGFAAYEMMLFSEMLADHGFFCDPGKNELRTLLGREPQSVDSAIRQYYARRQETQSRRRLSAAAAHDGLARARAGGFVRPSSGDFFCSSCNAGGSMQRDQRSGPGL